MNTQVINKLFELIDAYRKMMDLYRDIIKYQSQVLDDYAKTVANLSSVDTEPPGTVHHDHECNLLRAKNYRLIREIHRVIKDKGYQSTSQYLDKQLVENSMSMLRLDNETLRDKVQSLEDYIKSHK